MNLTEFVKKYLGIATDYDGVAGVQCVDLAKLFIDKVIGAKPESIGNAHAYYDNFENTYLKKYFKKIKYERGMKPKRGDLVVWGIKYNGVSENGHIAIATGEGNSVYLKTWDQNFGGKVMREIKHSYIGISGFLRPKDRNKVVDYPKITYGTYKLTNVRGIYKGYGADTGRKLIKEITEDAKKHATSSKSNAEAFLRTNTSVTIKETKLLDSGNLWAKIPSGYICIWEEAANKKFIK